MQFGPFQVGWSGSMDGWGFLYYSQMPGGKLSDANIRICATTAKIMEGLDGSSPSWLYRGSPSDLGTRGDIAVTEKDGVKGMPVVVLPPDPSRPMQKPRRFRFLFLWEFWLTLAFGVGVGWSVWKDWKGLRAKQQEQG